MHEKTRLEALAKWIREYFGTESAKVMIKYLKVEVKKCKRV